MNPSLNPNSTPPSSGLPTPGYADGTQNAYAQPINPQASAAIPSTQSQMLQGIIIRAKQLFEHPQINPYDQSRALQLLKAQYVYAKYHINLKVPQE
jgi:hypothetical protein